MNHDLHSRFHTRGLRVERTGGAIIKAFMPRASVYPRKQACKIWKLSKANVVASEKSIDCLIGLGCSIDFLFSASDRKYFCIDFRKAH